MPMYEFLVGCYHFPPSEEYYPQGVIDQLEDWTSEQRELAQAAGIVKQVEVVISGDTPSALDTTSEVAYELMGASPKESVTYGQNCCA